MLPFFLSLVVIPFVSCKAASLEQALAAARELHVSSEPTWHALLHFANNKCHVTDPSFLLENKKCSPEREVELLLRAAFSQNPDIAKDISCRFPARLTFLNDALRSRNLVVPFFPCDGLTEYEESAPAKTISLVFASENITHPISMMGHVFIKFEGANKAGHAVEHAASFFTRITTANIPQLISKSLLWGLPSFFALVPYSEQIKSYRELEKRSIWEYRLATTDFSRKLIQLHVWELRSIKTPYFFLGYNCATVVYFIISIANPALLQDLGSWITPAEVVQLAKKRGILASRSFMPSLDWQIRTYGEALGAGRGSIVDVLKKGSRQDIEKLSQGELGPLRVAFASAYTDRMAQTEGTFFDRAEFINSILEEVNAVNPITSIYVENLKDPLKRSKTSRLILGATRIDGDGYSKLQIVPASHLLSDDNRNSYSESALELASLSLLYNPTKGRPFVDKANLYAVDSLVPYDPDVGGLSSRFAIGAERQLDGSLSSFSAVRIVGGIGRTVAYGEDLRLYGLISAGLNYGDGRTALSYTPEIGMSIYEILSMKMIGSLRLNCGQHGADGCYQQFSATQSFLGESFAPYVSIDIAWDKERSRGVFELGVTKYF